MSPELARNINGIASFFKLIMENCCFMHDCFLDILEVVMGIIAGAD